MHRSLAVLYSLFQSILPLLLLSYFNVELIRSIQASSDFLKRCTPMNGQMLGANGEKSLARYREGSVTRSVICLIALFTLCQVPASILHYIYMFYRNDPILYICYDISNFLILVNSAVRQD
jgi:lipid A disaccharide synthetase